MSSFTTRLAGTDNANEGLKVATAVGGSHYVYELRLVDPDGDTLEVVNKTVDGDAVEPEATEHVEDVAADYGFEVAD